MRCEVEGRHLLKAILAMSFMKVVFSKCGYDLGVGIVVILENDSETEQIIKKLQETIDAKVVRTINELKDTERYEVAIHRYHKYERIEGLYKYLEFKNVLVLLMVSGILPDELEDYPYVIKLPKIPENEWEKVRRNFGLLKKLTNGKERIVQSCMDKIQKSDLYMEYCTGEDEMIEVKKTIVATAEIWGIAQEEEMSESIIRKWKKLYCEEVIEAFEGEDIRGYADIRDVVRNLIFDYLKRNRNIKAREIADGLSSDGKVIYYDEKTYYFSEQLLKEICLPIVQTTSFLHVKQEMLYSGTLKKNMVNVVTFAELNSGTQKIAAELVLSCMWKKIQRGKSENVMLIIDEFQNYIRKGSVLLEMMRESRKYGVSIVLATQTLEGIDSKANSAVKQAAVQMFFRVNNADTKKVAEMIDSVNADHWKMRLRQLKVGESVVTGMLNIGNREIDDPLVIRSEYKRKEDDSKLLIV